MCIRDSAWAFRKLRPIFRERSKIQAEVTGRLGESMGGVRAVSYTHLRAHETVLDIVCRLLLEKKTPPPPPPTPPPPTEHTHHISKSSDAHDTSRHHVNHLQH